MISSNRNNKEHLRDIQKLYFALFRENETQNKISTELMRRVSSCSRNSSSKLTLFTKIVREAHGLQNQVSLPKTKIPFTVSMCTMPNISRI